MKSYWEKDVYSVIDAKGQEGLTFAKRSTKQ